MQLKNITTGATLSLENIELLNLPTQQVKDGDVKSIPPIAAQSIAREYSANYANESPAKRSNSMILNGIDIKKISSKFFIKNINSSILLKKFPHNTICVDNEVVHYISKK